MLVDCPTDAETPNDVLFFPCVPERGTADDLTSDRANSESDLACCTYRTAKRKEQISPSSRELKGIGDDWPRPTTEFHDACVAAGRSQRAHEWRRRAALPRRLPCTPRSEPFSYLGLHLFVLETLSEI